MTSTVAGSLFSEPVFWTAALGICGILAAFFAPTWTQRKIEQRREIRDFRRATRLVAFELDGAAAALHLAIEDKSLPAGIVTRDEYMPLVAWKAEAPTLAVGLEAAAWKEVSDAAEMLRLIRASLQVRGVGKEFTDDIVLDAESLERYGVVRGMAERAVTALQQARITRD